MIRYTVDESTELATVRYNDPTKPIGNRDEWQKFNAWFDGAGYAVVSRVVTEVCREDLRRFIDYCQRKSKNPDANKAEIWTIARVRELV